MAIAVYGLGDSSWDGSSPLSASKQVHAHSYHYSMNGAVVAAIKYFGPMRAAGTLVGFEAAITETIATGADRTVSVDLKKSTGGGAFGTVLSAPIAFNNVSVLFTVSAGAFASSGLIDTDLLSINITVAGAAGNQALGLVARIFLTESYA
jgi:hypothetical protein